MLHIGLSAAKPDLSDKNIPDNLLSLIAVGNLYRIGLVRSFRCLYLDNPSSVASSDCLKTAVGPGRRDSNLHPSVVSSVNRHFRFLLKDHTVTHYVRKSKRRLHCLIFAWRFRLMGGGNTTGQCQAHHANRCQKYILYSHNPRPFYSDCPYLIVYIL